MTLRVATVMPRRDDQWHGRRSLKVRIATWNHHGRLPVGDLSELLGSSGAPDSDWDIVVIGGQECPTGGNSRDDIRGWSNMLKDHYCGPREVIATDKNKLGQDYNEEDLTDEESGRGDTKSPRVAVRRGPFKPLIKARLMGIYLSVLCHKSIIQRITNVRSDVVKTGALSGRIGNKGAVAIALKFDACKLAFVSVHLAPHQTEIEPRLRNISKIFRHLRVGENDRPDRSPQQTHGPEPRANDHLQKDRATRESPYSGVSSSWADSSEGEPAVSPATARIAKEARVEFFDNIDVVFLFGDLNFRIDLTRDYAEKQILKGEYAELIEKDQLRQLLDGDATNIFRLFEEPIIDFAPTYKFDTNKRIQEGSHRTQMDHETRPLDESRAELQTQAGPPEDKLSEASRSHAENETDSFMGSSNPISYRSEPKNHDAIVSSRVPVDSSETLGSDASRTGSPRSHQPTIGPVPTKDTTGSETTKGFVARSYDSSDKRRVPSWTDRILYHSKSTSKRLELELNRDNASSVGAPGGAGDHTDAPAVEKGDVRCLFYRSVTSDMGARSDHQPVVGAYEIGL